MVSVGFPRSHFLFDQVVVVVVDVVVVVVVVVVDVVTRLISSFGRLKSSS